LQIGWSTMNESSLPRLPEPATEVWQPSLEPGTDASPEISSLVSGFQPLTVTLLMIADELSRGASRCSTASACWSTLSVATSPACSSGCLTCTVLSSHQT